MKKLFLFLFCMAGMAWGFAQEPDSLSLKDRIFYHYDRSEFAEVVLCCNEALAVYQATDDYFEMAGCYNILGIAYQRMGKFKEAIDSYESCAEAMERLKASEYAVQQEGAAEFYDKNIRYTRNNMAEIYYAMDDFDHAEELYRSCIEMLGEPKDTIDYLDKATYLQNLSAVFLKRSAQLEGAEKEGRLNESVRLAEQALTLSRQYGDLPFKLISKMLMLSQVYHAMGRTQEALALADEALSVAETEKDSYLQAEIHGVYGEYEAVQGHYVNAESHYLKAVELAEENHFDELLWTSLNGAYEAARHYDKGLALDYLERSTVLKDSIFNEEQQRLLLDYQMRYELSEKDHLMALQEERSHRDKQMIIFLVLLAALLLVLLIVGFRLGRMSKQKNIALNRLNKAKDHLFSVVSHDFKTSMVSQAMMLEAMNQFYDKMSSEQVKEKLLTLQTSADALKEKLFNLFEWIKIELGSNESNDADFNLRDLVNECVAANAAELGQKGLRVVSDLPDLMASDNRNMVRLVLQNLLSNAIKFSWPNQEIEISVRQEDNRYWVTVEDHGTGIQPDCKDRLVKEMVTPSQGTMNESGTGIGLMLCGQLLAKNGGEIVIESEEGKGTKVRFTVMSSPKRGIKS